MAKKAQKARTAQQSGGRGERGGGTPRRSAPGELSVGGGGGMGAPPTPLRQWGRAGATPATVALTAAGAAFTLHSYEHDTAHPPPAPKSPGGAPTYGEQAAEALGLPAERVFKTLVAEVDGALTVAVVPVAGSLDLKALAAAVGAKRATMADPADAERSTGYVRGGISPLGQRRKLPTVLDSSAHDHPTICVSAGRRGLEIELAAADLQLLTGAVTAEISRG